jgi:hypothetical protein
MVLSINRRVSAEDRHPDFQYYEIRHADDDWDMPISIENNVMVNFWGTIITDEKLDLQNGVKVLTSWDADEFRNQAAIIHDYEYYLEKRG